MNHNRSSSGFSLVEVLVAMALLSLLMGIVVAMLMSLLRAERDGHAGGVAHQATWRLRDDLRADLHAAKMLRVDPVDTLNIEGESTHIKYVLDNDGCLREVLNDEGDVSQRERYAVGRGAAWRVEERAGAWLAELRQTADAGQPRDSPPIQVVASRRPESNE